MNYIEPEETQLERMAIGDPEEPVYMLNLLKYRDKATTGAGVDGMMGEKAYRHYGHKFAELNSVYGGEPVWMGKASNTIIGTEDWDLVILVRYPTRRQFLEMLRSSEYKAIAPIRAAGLADSRLYETNQLLPRI